MGEYGIAHPWLFKGIFPKDKHSAAAEEGVIFCLLGREFSRVDARDFVAVAISSGSEVNTSHSKVNPSASEVVPSPFEVVPSDFRGHSFVV
jgi:hypothetical protein